MGRLGRISSNSPRRTRKTRRRFTTEALRHRERQVRVWVSVLRGGGSEGGRRRRRRRSPSIARNAQQRRAASKVNVARTSSGLQLPHLQSLSRETETARLPIGTHRHRLDDPRWPLRVRSSRPLHIPHLQRVVPRRGDRAPPVRGHRHATDRISVAFQRAQLAPALQIPHLQRVVLDAETATARPPSPPRA